MNEIKMTTEQRKLFATLSGYGIHRYDEDCPLYKYVDIETAIKILKTHTAKFSTSVELDDNDMDMSLLAPNVSEQQKRETVKEMLTDEFSKYSGFWKEF